MKTGYRMKTTSRKDYLQRIYHRYRRAAQSKKGHILDKFCANCGYHRKYAIRLLNGPPPGAKPVLQPRRRRAVSYSARVISILKARKSVQSRPETRHTPEYATPYDP